MGCQAKYYVNVGIHYILSLFRVTMCRHPISPQLPFLRMANSAACCNHKIDGQQKKKRKKPVTHFTSLGSLTFDGIAVVTILIN